MGMHNMGDHNKTWRGVDLKKKNLPGLRTGLP